MAETRTQLFERLRTAGLIQPVDARTINPTTKFFRVDLRCAYHSGGAGNDTEGCINLKHKIQDLIDNRVIILQALSTNVNLNPLPYHGEATINRLKVTKIGSVMGQSVKQMATHSYQQLPL